MGAAKQFEEVSVEMLRWHCPSEYLPFETSDEIEPLKGIIGQNRAVEAIKLGLEMESDGYNVFVTGLTGTDRIPTIQQLMDQIKKPDMTPPHDICCVHNFKDPDSPKIIHMSAGKGIELKKDIIEFIAIITIAVSFIITITKIWG